MIYAGEVFFRGGKWFWLFKSLRLKIFVNTLTHFMKPIFAAIFCFLLIACSQKETEQQKPVPKETDTIPNRPSPIKGKYCQRDTFNVLGICKPHPPGEEFYQIALSCEPFKAFVHLSVRFEGDSLSSIFYSVLDFSTRLNEKKVAQNDFVDSVAMNEHRFFFYYDSPRKIESPRQKQALQKVKTFFKDYFWKCEPQDCSGFFDGEYWTVISNFGGKERKITRCLSDDPQFYEPIEILLKLAGNKEYRFERRK